MSAEQHLFWSPWPVRSHTHCERCYVIARDHRPWAECSVEDGDCLVHEVADGIGHYLETRSEEHRGHNPVSGIAYND